MDGGAPTKLLNQVYRRTPGVCGGKPGSVAITPPRTTPTLVSWPVCWPGRLSSTIRRAYYDGATLNALPATAVAVDDVVDLALLHWNGDDLLRGATLNL